MPSFSPRAAPSGAAPHRPMPRWPPMRPQRKRRASRVPRAARGECEGRPGGRWFSGLFSGRPAPSPGKEPGKASRPLPGKRVPRQAAVARLGPSWKRGVRPGREAGEGDPQGPALGRGSGAARAPGSGKGPDRSEGGSGIRHADFVYAGVNNRSMRRRFGASGPHGGAVVGKAGAIGVLKLDTAMPRRRARTKDVSGARW